MKNRIYKIGFAALAVICIVMGSIIYATHTLEKETEKMHLHNAKLHVKIFTEEMSHTFLTIDRLIDFLSQKITDHNVLESEITSILSEYNFIRSISILDKTHTIIQSSNQGIIGKTIDIDQYYPKPMFSSDILRFGKSLNARDFFERDDSLSLLPVSRELIINQEKFFIICNINNDYFINKFSQHLYKNVEDLELLRIDKKLLLTTSNDTKFAQKSLETKLFQEALHNNQAAGIEYIEGKKYILAYYLTEIFPFAILIKYDYEALMQNWDSTKNLVLLVLFAIVIFIVATVVNLLIRYLKSKEKAIKYHDQLTIDQEKLENAYIVYNHTNDGILITDANRNIIDVNAAFTSTTGYSKEEVVGKNPSILHSDLYEKDFYKEMWDSVHSNNFWHGEIINKTKDNEAYTELLTINKVLDKTGKVKNYIGIFTNISKEKAQEKAIQEQEKFIFQQSKMAAMGEMLQNIAHQWRQPLSVISTAATGMKIEKEFGMLKDEVLIERLSLINDSAQFLSTTIDDFRDFFHPEKEKVVFYIKDIINKSLNIIYSKFKSKGIEVIQNIDTIQMSGYKNELMQVMINLLNNSRDILEEQISGNRFVFIEASLEKSKNQVRLTIKDTGGGIDENVIEKVFDAYFTTKEQEKGTGIGLYMSKEIISKHMKGNMSVQNIQFSHNKKFYQGALFTISLPIE